MPQVYDIEGILSNIDFLPKTTEDEIIQNVRNIIVTALDSVPYARSLGMGEVLDRPILTAKAQLSAVLTIAIMDGEPRAEVVSVSFNETAADAADGRIIPVVRVRLLNG